MLTSKKLKKVAKDFGTDLVGIGSMDRFEGAPKNYDPRYIMPKAKSIIGLGFRIHRGLLRGIEEGTYFSGYPSMGYSNINDVYSPIVLRRVASYLEDYGYEALPYHNSSVRLGINEGRAASPDKPKPDVFIHMRIAGVICGMGEIGWSNLFLTPEFGPAQRLMFIITEAELEPDPVFKEQICDECKLCVRDCPAGAISKSESTSITILGRKFTWAVLDEYKCGAVFQVGTRETSPFISDEVANVIDNVIKNKNEHKKGMMNYDKGGDIWDYLRENVPYNKNAWENFKHPAAICGGRGCIRACLAHLEQKGVLKNKFKHPFRQKGREC